MSVRHLQVRVGIVIAALSLTACGGGGDANSSTEAPKPPLSPGSPVTPPIVTRSVDQSDLDIATMIYAGAPRTPADFYSEAPPDGLGVVATSHVKNTDIDQSLAASAPQFELCTNDWNEALTWSETTAQNASTYSSLVATNDEGRYFEFGRVRSGTPTSYLQSRVYKCAYLDRSAANLRDASGAAGTLNVRPLSADALKSVSEYLWQFTTYNNFGHAVLNSEATNSSPLEHTLHIASLAREGVSPRCDRIDVFAWRHSVNPSSGSLTLSLQPQFSFGAREEAGVAQLCTN